MFGCSGDHCILHAHKINVIQALAAEVTATFSRRLSPLNLVVRELTGDMQLTKNEIEETQVCSTSFCSFNLVILRL